MQAGWILVSSLERSPAWSEARLLSLGYAFEQATHARKNPTFPASISLTPEIAGAYDPPPR